MLCMKKSSLGYFGCQKKKSLLQNLIICCLLILESLGQEDIKDFSTRSPFAVKNIAIELSEVIQSNVVKKIEKSETFAVSTDEASNIYRSC